MKKMAHIGIAVKNLEEASRTFSALLQCEPYKTEDVPREKVRVAFFRVGDLCIELLEAAEASSPVQRFLDKRGEGVHHVAFEVDDIASTRERLVKEGFTALAPPKEGAEGKAICFFHPKSTHGVLVELCQHRRSQARATRAT